jgi:hypothetical protein
MSDWDFDQLNAIAEALNDAYAERQPAEWVVRHDELQAEAEERGR